MLKKKQVDYVHVSHYEELSVKNLWTDLKKDIKFNPQNPKTPEV